MEKFDSLSRIKTAADKIIKFILFKKERKDVGKEKTEAGIKALTKEGTKELTKEGMKDKGSVEYSLALLLAGIVVILILFIYRLHVIKITKYTVEDAIAASNLAAAVIDLEEFGSTNEIVIKSSDDAYRIFQEALRDNLNLDGSFNPDKVGLMKGKVTIDTFIVYNVKDNDITQISYDSLGNSTINEYPDSTGLLYTPDNKCIYSTTIYSKIGFSIKGYQDEEYYVYKENSVDIVNNDIIY